MNNGTLSLISAITSAMTAIAAIISPIIVTCINNKHSLKLKKMDNYDIAKREILEKFCISVGKYTTNITDKSSNDLINSFYNLIPYFNINFFPLEYYIDSILSHNDISEDLNQIIMYLKQQL